MTTADRMAQGYEPRWDICLETGKQGELFTVRIVDGIQTGSSEVKTDERALETGNVYLEYQCQYRGEWRPSALATTEAEGGRGQHASGQVGASPSHRRTRRKSRAAHSGHRGGRIGIVQPFDSHYLAASRYQSGHGPQGARPAPITGSRVVVVRHWTCHQHLPVAAVTRRRSESLGDSLHPP